MLYAILAYHVEGEILSWSPAEDAAVVAKVIEVQAPLRAKRTPWAGRPAG